MRVAEMAGFDVRTSPFVLTSDVLLPKLMSGDVWPAKPPESRCRAREAQVKMPTGTGPE